MKNAAADSFSGNFTFAWLSGDPRRMILTQMVTYRDRQGELWTATSGRTINGASVPWFFRRIFPAYIGRYRRATVLHDVACEDKREPSWKVHRMFYQAMRCGGTNVVTAWLMWAAVRMFGPRFSGDSP